MNKKAIVKGIMPLVITILIFFIVLLLKGIYPFGNLQIGYYDNVQQVIPVYTHLWDVLHGQANLFFDWYTGLGTNFSMTISAFSLLSPFNILLYLIPRANIEKCLFIFIIIKLAFTSETMYIYLNKKFNKMHYIFKLLFSLVFTFSGYQMLYCTAFMPWMDVVAFFPLLMLALEDILQNKSYIYYVILLTLCLIINYYISALILLFILIISGLYIIYYAKKEERKNIIYKLGVGTFISIGLAAFILIPAITQLMNSQRFNGDNITLLDDFRNILNSMPQKGNWRLDQYIIYTSLSLPVAIILWGIFKYREEKNIIKMFFVLILIMVLPLLIEGTNLLLHFGSYNAYNMRYGFIITFIFLAIASYFASKIEIKTEKETILKTVLYIILLLTVSIAITRLYPQLERYVSENYYYSYSLNIYALFFILQFTLIVYLFIFAIRKNSKNMLLLIGILQIFFFVYMCIGRPGWFKYESFQDGSYIQKSYNLKKELEIPDDKINRIQNPDLTLNANFPILLKKAGISDYTTGIPNYFQNMLKKLGYGCGFHIYILDSGGTVFSNALLNIKQAINSLAK